MFVSEGQSCLFRGRERKHEHMRNVVANRATERRREPENESFNSKRVPYLENLNSNYLGWCTGVLLVFQEMIKMIDH